MHGTGRHFPIIVAALGLTLTLIACGGGGGGSGTVATGRPAPAPTPTPPTSSNPASNPAHHLGTARFTTHQPGVLERIGAHHAYARGLTGKGVRIGIDDSIVDYTQSREFGDRVKLRDADGASLAYNHPFGDSLFGDVASCLQWNPSCRAWRANSQGEDEALNGWVRRIVEEAGWPTGDDSTFVVDEHYDKQNPLERLFRWWEVPTPYGSGVHGTQVASVAAGTNLGVAPEATIIPIAQNLTDDQSADTLADDEIRNAIASLSDTERGELDNLFARDQRDDYAKFDIINRSYGRAIFDPNVVSEGIESELRWWRRYLPKTLDAILQADRPDAEKTIIIYAAGNEGEPWSGPDADLPYYIPALRGHSLSVAATDPKTGAIAAYSNRCGPLPPDWDAARHGPHYCLAAPGTVRVLTPDPTTPGRGDVDAGVTGTSFAAPVVSGALALLMEHFRGTRGNTEVVKRMLDTADRSGRYADLETYGAGHLDIEAALSPVGALSAGQSASALAGTALQLPAAFGSVARRAAGIELAAFDEQDFPFWVPLSALVSTRPAGRSPIPRFDEAERALAPRTLAPRTLAPGTLTPRTLTPGAVTPAVGLDALGLRWMPVGEAGSPLLPDGDEWVAGLGETSASIARRPGTGGWGYGLGFDGGDYLGARPSGAFGSDLRSGMAWASRAFGRALGGGWRLDGAATLAVSRARYEKGALFQASPSVLSALSLRLGTEGTGVTVEQPLRAETGTGTFRVENGRMENGRRLYDEYRVPLRPEARALRMTLRHERKAAGGRVAIQVGGAMNAGHVPGEHETNVGFAYRLTW